MGNRQNSLIKLLIRCSSLHKIVGEPKTKADKDAGILSQTAKSHVIEIAKQNLFGFSSFDGSRETEKGNALEKYAVDGSGLIRALHFEKNTERRENEYISGECDIYYPAKRLIVDTKCSWDIGTHPFFRCEAEAKVKASGYDWQMQGYMWLFDCDRADIDFWLFPCPEDLIGYGNPEKLIDAVEAIPLSKRVTTVTIMRDDEKINRIKERVNACQKYYEELIQELE